MPSKSTKKEKLKKKSRDEVKEAEQLYGDSSSSDDEQDDKKTSSKSDKNKKKNKDNVRYLTTDRRCYTGFESIMIELCMFLSYAFVVACIALILTGSVYGARHKYFEYFLIGTVSCCVLSFISFYLYQTYNDKVRQNAYSVPHWNCIVLCLIIRFFLSLSDDNDKVRQNAYSEYFCFDKEKNLLQIYAAKKTFICNFWTLRNESELLWQCSLSAMRRCEYLENVRVLVFYFYDAANGNEEMKQFRRMYFTNQTWEKAINNKLTQCKLDWNLRIKPSPFDPSNEQN
eukprot:CAMPEP_0197075726 /NCGR_PEP_ID=MMETSP1384-20130603/211757_1 /TAXON_ID=29189 /ORGANISM="Ammonia sp." /LENGTH=284 /DNA_ID=CAMNT_0042514575 /DNA_START=8 /DNA_END=863 /DNA_ORIENTATION=+